ncbi:MAG: YkgJ family cysteine cluster protein [Haloferacaceae archaeon]
MDRLETELARARALPVAALADAVESIGFECTRCGACCKGYVDCGAGDAADESDGPADGAADAPADGGDDADGDGDPHTATVFPDEIRRLRAAATASDDPALDETYDWRDIARPMPYGLGGDGDRGDGTGETFEWALATDDCGDCTFYDESDGEGRCTVHGDRPLICRTYPFSVGALSDDGGGAGTTEPMGGVVDREGAVRAHECEGLGRDISRTDAEDLARALKERAIRELEEAIAVRDRYEPAAPGPGETVVHDSEGAKRPDGRPYRG